jgi:hypothetical protein
MTTLIACDLDRTLIYSSSAMTDPTPDGLRVTALEHSDPICVEHSDPICVERYDGAPLSFMTRRSAELLQNLSTAAVFVPTTTRTITQYQRITLPGGPHRYAITSNGGNILIDGRPDPDWQANTDALIRNSCAPLAHITTELQSRLDDKWVKSFRTAESLFCYLVVDLTSLPTYFVAEWSSWCAERNWMVSTQGRKIYSIPATLCKSIAVAEVRNRLAAEGRDPLSVLAAGDGALDAELLRYADAAIRPRHGELEAIGFRAPGITVTSATSIAAGEEILGWLSTIVANATMADAGLTPGAR